MKNRTDYPQQACKKMFVVFAALTGVLANFCLADPVAARHSKAVVAPETDGQEIVLGPGDGNAAFNAAFERIRAGRTKGTFAAEKSVTVILKPGDYRLKSAVELPDDLGGEGAPVVFRAEKPGTVRISGGVRLEAGRFAPVTDAAVRARLRPEARDRVLVADISAEVSRPLAPWPDAANRPPAPWLYMDGKPCEIARWPNSCNGPERGWARFTKAYRTGFEGKAKAKGFDHVQPGKGAFLWEGAADVPRRWNVAEGAWLFGYWTHDWREDILRIESFAETASNKVMALKGVHYYGIAAGTWGAKERRFFALNLLEELDAPGEFWIDRVGKKLYVVPTADFATAEIVLATLAEPMFRTAKDRRVAGFRFENLDFCYSHCTEKTAVRINGCGNEFRGCRFFAFGGSGLEFAGERNRLVGCEIRDIDGTGIRLTGGNQQELLPACNAVEDTEIHRYTRYARTYNPAVGVYGVGQVVRGCSIHDAAHTAILYGGNDHLFESNEVWRVLTETGDAGAVYSGRRTDTLGNIIRFNRFHDLGGDPEHMPYTMAVYFDDCDWGDAVYSNRFERLGCGVFIGGGNLHPVVGNVFEDCRIGVHVDARGVTFRERGVFLPDPKTPDVSWFERWIKPMNYRSGVWAKRYPELAGLIDDRPELPRMNPIVDNRFIGCQRAFGFDQISCGVTNEMPVVRNVILSR